MLCGSKFNVNHEDWWLFSRSNFDMICQNEPYHTIHLLLNTSSGRYMIRVFGVTRESGVVDSFEQVVAVCYKSFHKTVACFGLSPEDETLFCDRIPPAKSENCSNFYKLGNDESQIELTGRGQCDHCKTKQNGVGDTELNEVGESSVAENQLENENINESETVIDENSCPELYGNESEEKEESLSVKEDEADICDINDDDSTSNNEEETIDHTYSNSKNLKCSLCPVILRNTDKLNRHVLKRHVGEHECEFCGKRFFSRRLLIDHTVTHTKEKPYTCDECGASFGFRSTYKVHLKTHQRKSATTKGLTDNLYYKCDKCTKKFTQIGGLHRHKRHVHEKNFDDAQCELCGANFRTATLYKQHFQRFHSDTPKFQCEICSVPFGRKEHLVRHMLTHDMSTAHICPHCGRAFKRKDGLTVHLRTHTGDRPFKCSYVGCSWAGLDSSSFSRHKKTVHGIAPAARCKKTQAREEPNNLKAVENMDEKEVVLELVTTEALDTIEIVEPLDYSLILDEQKESDVVGYSITQEKSVQNQFEMSTECLMKAGLIFSQTN